MDPDLNQEERWERESTLFRPFLSRDFKDH